MAGTLKVDSINADSNLALKIANTAVAFIDATGLRPTSGNVSLDATATSKFYLPSANTVAIQTAGVTAVTVDSSQNVTLAGTLTTTGITNSGVATGARFNPTGSSVTGNGMYLPAANSLGLSTNGTERMRIDSSGNVGIGTASPVVKLNVVGSSNANNAGIAGGSYGIRFENGVTYSLTGSAISGVDNTFTTSFQPLTVNGSQLGFAISGTEAMRINASGNVGIGTTSPTVKLFVAASDTGPRIAVDQTADNAADMITFRRNGSERGKIYISDSATVYQTSSDYRLKKNITPLTGSLETVAKLKPSSFTWVQERGGQQDTGFIAHELAEVMPQAVTGEKDATREEEYEVTPAVKDEQGKITTPAVMGTRTVPSYQGIDTSFLVATLTAAIQELKVINDTQAATIAALTARMVAVESK